MRPSIVASVCLAAQLGLALGCSGRRPPAPREARRAEAGPDSQEPNADEDEEADEPAPRRERRLDPSISVDNLRARLSPYIDSIGAGFGAGFRPSGMVSVAAGGDVIYERALGRADINADEANTDDTSFGIGALTAQFTAAAVLRLAQAKKLALGDSIAKFVPDYPALGAGISVRQLLTHTSGLPNYLTKPELLDKRAKVFTPRELLELFWNEPLEFEPGTDFGYSDSDYVVLGVIMEKVTRRAYAEHMQDDIFDRFDLDDTSVGATDATDDVARSYSVGANGGLEPTSGYDGSILYSAAGVRSTVHDLLAWHDALQEGKVFDAKREKLSLEVVKNDYACGWFVHEQHGHRVASHWSGVGGFASAFVRVPDLDLAIVVLLNNASADAKGIADAALGIALGEKIEPLRRQTSVPLDAGIAARIIGTYRLSEAAAKDLEKRKVPKRALLAMRSVRIYQEGNELLFKPAGQAGVLMVATGRSSFVLVGGKGKIEVPLDPGDKPATQLLLEQGPLRVDFTRRARQRGKPDEPETSDGEPTP